MDFAPVAEDAGIKISQVNLQWHNLNKFSYRTISTARNIIRFKESNPILQDVAHAPDSNQDIPPDRNLDRLAALGTSSAKHYNAEYTTAAR